MDYGSRYADKRLRILDIRLRKVYRQAEKEIEKKLGQFTAKKQKKNNLLLKKLDDGEITEQQYKEWLAGQAFMEKQWKMKQEQVTASLLHANEEALAIVRGEQLNVFAENANHQAYEIEQDFSGAYSFGIYDKKTVENLIANDPELLPPRKVNKRKDRAWNQGIINNCVTQGIIQGESVDKIAKRIAKDTSSQDRKAMMRYARTAMTSAQNAGRMEMLKRAEGMGIRVQKEWLSAHDNRTRDSHRRLDGQIEDINKPFHGEFSDIMFPGDPSAHPAEVYNCRCRMTYVYPDYQKHDTDQGWREREEIDGQSYDEWKEGKKAQKKVQKKFNFTDDKIEISGAKEGISEESAKKISEAFEDVYSLAKPLKGYMNEIKFGDVPGIASTSIDGKSISLDKKAFSTIESMQSVLNQAKETGHTVNTNDPRFIIAHDLGHCMESYIVTKRCGLQTAYIGDLQVMMIENERKNLGISYFLHMGFEDEKTEEIYAIIQSELGTRALDSPSEMAAQAVAQVLYGTEEAPHAKNLVNYLISEMGD